MDNLSLVSCSSPKMVVGVLGTPKNPIFFKPFNHFPTKSTNLDRIRGCFSHVLAVSCSQTPQSAKKIVIGRERSEAFASIFSSGSQETSSSVGVNPQLPVPQSSSNVGSPLFWVGVGVGLSAVFSWVASSLKKYAMQQAFKTMMGPMSTQNNQSSNAGFGPGSPFPFPPPPSNAGFGTGSPFPFPPPSSATQTASYTSEGPSVASRPVTVDVPATEVEEPAVAATEVEQPAVADVKDKDESEKAPKKFAFVDVSPEETIKKSDFDRYKEAIRTDSLKAPKFAEPVSQNGSARRDETGTSEASSTGAGSFMSVEALEKMMEDPTVQKMVYPYLPEEMRNPTTFKWMLQNPQYRQQLQDMLNNMGGSPEWDNRMMDTLKNFNLDSPDVKQQFDQIGLTPEEVISKIMANPDVAMAFQNPRVQAAIMDCSQNPLSIAKYQNDKEVMDVFNKISELFPGVTGPP
ncbi:hypothetical protein Leryth_010739 [Lithospermum erythrorhizon]|nr:hypothetical protein Leryth_010739 [Lithospermum erythrorhizon]